jgi:colicin import membrane protein
LERQVERIIEKQLASAGAQTAKQSEESRKASADARAKIAAAEAKAVAEAKAAAEAKADAEAKVVAEAIKAKEAIMAKEAQAAEAKAALGVRQAEGKAAQEKLDASAKLAKDKIKVEQAPAKKIDINKKGEQTLINKKSPVEAAARAVYKADSDSDSELTTAAGVAGAALAFFALASGPILALGALGAAAVVATSKDDESKAEAQAGASKGAEANAAGEAPRTGIGNGEAPQSRYNVAWGRLPTYVGSRCEELVTPPSTNASREGAGWRGGAWSMGRSNSREMGQELGRSPTP